jgi:hypothetical protein
MEHLRAPEGAEPIDVPYVGTEERWPRIHVLPKAIEVDRLPIGGR